MRSQNCSRRLSAAFVSLAVVVVPVVLLSAVFSAAFFTASSAEAAARSRSSKRLKLGQFNPRHETVEMFTAMEEGQIKVRFIPKDSSQARVLITNKTKKPLNVKLPEAFAAVPVLAQMGGGGMGGGGMGGGGGGGQSMGGGMGGGGMGGGGMGGGGMGGGGGGMFNVPAEKVGNLKVPCVCLEHGKPEPRPAMEYTIMPIEQFSDEPAVRELCTLLGYGLVDQRSAQAAAWNLNGDLSWHELAAKEIRRLDGRRYPYFSQRELQAAISIAARATTMAADKEQGSEESIASESESLGKRLSRAETVTKAD